MAATLELMKLSDNVEEQLHGSTEEELSRQSCLENLTAILTKLMAKCKASGDTLDAGTHVSTLVAGCESKVWQETYETCGNIEIYAEAMALKQTDFETCRVQVGQHPWFTDDAGAVKFTSGSNSPEKIEEKTVEPADDVKEEEDGLLAAVLGALDEGKEEVTAVMEALGEEDQSSGHAEEQDAEDTANKNNVTPVVSFDPSRASPRSSEFAS
ncbi:hypothetical protein E8E11_011027 [Didymella keratinophila]|nr:hypothetical protein E8E11_011027 [Didymella keratinophila]